MIYFITHKEQQKTRRCKLLHLLNTQA
ncbi:hypothetical protein F383_35438 [Gossypium arboreum]|uniref:Uncharacterized protein n=1 Tax=Gossypium arboreum TaxID=29729 RepID=A0A0B0NCC4_GOSAR|nr:hypothetical protein F383_35438 [Gossypium arboreum]